MVTKRYKRYDTKKALDKPGQPEESQEVDYASFIKELPKEFQAEVEEAIAALLSYIHSAEGSDTILKTLQAAGENMPAEIGKAALQVMDNADPEHKWSDSAKMLAGYFAVSEVAGLAREAGISKVSKKEEADIFRKAAENYMHYMIKSKPTQPEREAEAVRLQKEVEPLMNEKMRSAGMVAAKEHGVQHEGQSSSKKGLLE